MKKVIVIAGVTATGKTLQGVKLAKKYNGEIINADSVSIYKDLNIGSAKASLEEQDGVKHHLLDQLSLEENYSVADFQRDARVLIDEIIEHGKVPIIVGGTGLYINALIYDYHFEKQELVEVDENLSNVELKEMLDELDAESSRKIHINNRKRLQRAVQIAQTHGKSKSEVNKSGKDKQVYDAKVFFLQGDRKKLYERINERVDIMFEDGLLEEVEGLFRNNKNFFELKSASSIGYQEFKEYFLGNIPLTAVKELIKRNTRRLAKRQITWFKHQTSSKWLNIFENDVFESLDWEIKKFLNQ